MRQIILTVLFAIASLPTVPSAVAGAQTIQFLPDVIVLKYDWYKSSDLLSPAFRPFQAANEGACESSESIRELYEERWVYFPAPHFDSYSEGLSPAVTGEQRDRERGEKEQFVYRVQVRNSGQRTIKEIVWEYVFSDPRTGAEVGRHTFDTETDLRSGKTKTLIAESVKPPTRVISVQMLRRGDSNTYEERVEIRRIVYADGSVWETE